MITAKDVRTAQSSVNLRKSKAITIRRRDLRAARAKGWRPRIARSFQKAIKAVAR